MKTRVVRMLTGVLLCALTACATEPAHISLKPELSQRVNSSNVVILAVQKEIVADVERSDLSGSTGGGLLTGVLDAGANYSRAKLTEAGLGPIRDVLAGYDVGAELHQALSPRLKTIPWLHVKKVEVVRDDNPKLIPSLLAASSEDALLLVIPSYRLTSNFSILAFDTQVRVVPRATHLMPPDAGDDAEKRMAPLYKTMIADRTSLPGREDSIPTAANAWVSDGGKYLKESLQQSVRRMADQIIEALNNPEQVPSML